MAFDANGHRRRSGIIHLGTVGFTSITIFASCAAGASPTAAIGAETLPQEAVAVIAKVHAASASQDLATLREQLAEEFTWSFGGDGSAEQALNVWKSHPKLLVHLHRVTGRRCGYIAAVIQCPLQAGLGYRAGFKQTPSGWRMVYFVSGD